MKLFLRLHFISAGSVLYTVYETADRKRNVRIMKCRIFLFCYTGDTPKVSLGLQTSFGHCKPLNIGFSLTCRDCTVPKIFRIRACQGWRMQQYMSGIYTHIQYGPETSVLHRARAGFSAEIQIFLRQCR